VTFTSMPMPWPGAALLEENDSEVEVMVRDWRSSVKFPAVASRTETTT